MTSKAFGLAQLGNAYSDGALSNRNLIINGAMEVAQRGTSHSTEGYGSLDRFYLGLSGGTATMSQQSLTLGQTDLPSQFRKFLRIAAATGNNNLGLTHRIEDVDSIEGACVLSFYAKGTNSAGGNLVVKVNQSFGSGGSSPVTGSEIPFTLTSSWQRFEVPITLPSLSGKTVGSGSSIEINFIQPNADTGTAAWTLDITGVQLEAGDTATPFEHRSYGQELALCQRYYEQSDFIEYYQFPSSSGAQVQRQNKWWRVTKRAAPTVATTKTGGSAGAIVATDGISKNAVYFSFGGAQFDIITWSWTASAEL